MKKKKILSAGEMSEEDIQPGGEYYDAAQEYYSYFKGYC